MCEPVLLGSALIAASEGVAATAATAGLFGAGGAFSLGTTLTTLSAASAAAGLVGQVQGANAQGKADEQQYHNSMLVRGENANQVGLERQQATDAASQKINENNIALREAQAAQVARAGPSGLSVDALLANLGTRGANYNDSVTQNLERTNMALDSQLVNVGRTATNQINSLKSPQQPDYLGAALKIGTAYKAKP